MEFEDVMDLPHAELAAALAAMDQVVIGEDPPTRM
jgi:hypothetical protein